MGSATATAALGRVLLGATGQGDDWSELRDHLVDLGWRVDPFDPIPPIDSGGPEVTLPRLDGVDHVVLIVSGASPSVVQASRLLHAVGVLQGQLGFGRVLALVDEEIEPFLAGIGVTELRYEHGNVRARFSQVAALLGEASAPEVPPAVVRWFAQLGLVDRDVAPEWWLAAGVLAVVATVLIVSVVQIAGSVGAGGSGDEVAVVPLTSVLSGASALDTDSGEHGSVTALPAQCTIDTRPGVLLPREIPCEGAGGLLVEGYLGPWHSEISLVSMDEGVVGDILLTGSGPARSAARVPLLSEAEQPIAANGPVPGVDEISLLFSANGQRVRLHQLAERGGNELTVTFSLDL